MSKPLSREPTAENIERERLRHYEWDAEDREDEKQGDDHDDGT